MIIGNIKDYTQDLFISDNSKLKEALDYLTSDNRINVENEFTASQEPFFGKHMIRRVSDVGIMSSHQRFSVDALRLCLGDHRKSRQEQKGQNLGRK